MHIFQVQVIKSPETECYECEEKPNPKTYAYCTIRSSPKEPVHCVIWAKEEFRCEFGGEEGEVPEEPSEDEELKHAMQCLKDLEKKDYSEWLFYKVIFETIAINLADEPFNNIESDIYLSLYEEFSLLKKIFSLLALLLFHFY